MGRQVFLIKPDGTTDEITTQDKPIKDILETEESYVIVDDDVRKVFLWKGENFVKGRKLREKNHALKEKSCAKGM